MTVNEVPIKPVDMNVLAVGIPAHIKRYSFLREAVKMVIENPDVINRITKELYPGSGGAQLKQSICA